MADPEVLQDEGARLGRRRSWVVLGVVLVVVVGLAALRFGTSGAETLPGPTESPGGRSSPAPQSWPADLPPGTLFASAAGAVHTIDTHSGALTKTSVATELLGTSLTRLADGVLVWREDSSASHAMLFDGRSLYPVPGALRSATAFLPGPDGRVWALTGRRSGRTTWRLVDADGRATRSVVADGTAISDGAGGLLDVRERSFRPLFPPTRRSWQTGDVIATGPAGYVVRSCTPSVCRFRLRQDGDDPGTNLDTAVGEDTSAGTLSPANRLLAVTETVGGTSTLRVSVVATGEVKDIFPTPKQSTKDAVWLDDRWLALISEDHLVLYDADDDRVITPDVALGSIGPLAWKAL